ncbi:carbamoyltransferase HypF [Candidatus Poribacteria bacterium]|nr:carbamoyltransferase HypF [Candidatus Poribacteria bacterium]
MSLSELRAEPCIRERARITGIVQGVGFRPSVYRLAAALQLSGWVENTPQGVTLEVEGAHEAVAAFFARLPAELPAIACIESLEKRNVPTQAGERSFVIRPSAQEGDSSAIIQADLATCPECLAEVFDPANRRYLYPFTNCTHCGPRFSIITARPYDRPNTTMQNFVMCPECQAEYDNPDDRRFHAQPNACPRCGPRAELWANSGEVLSRGHDAILDSIARLRRGEVLALKGLGGFHLLVDAGNEHAVRLLRERKHRAAKPLAVLFPSLDSVAEVCEIESSEEQDILRSPQAPIVLLRRKHCAQKPLVCNDAAPDNPGLGVLLPYTPLHHILSRAFGGPLVATSGNLSEEPICTDEREALNRLDGIADCFLMHNRPIARPVEDSVVRYMDGALRVLRRARGYAPLPVSVPISLPDTIAVGAHLKNTVALGRGGRVFLSSHIGDLESAASLQAHESAIASFRKLYRAERPRLACDLHPDHESTHAALRLAQREGLPLTSVQHHAAHVYACMAENQVPIGEPVLGFCWDGTGYGTDGTVWGGEVLRIEREGSFVRVAALRSFALPGGEAAVREPRRTAAGLLHEAFGHGWTNRMPADLKRAFREPEILTLSAMMERNLNCPRTSSIGRLLDAIASLLGLCHVHRYEGEAPMLLEFLAGDSTAHTLYPVPEAISQLDWKPMLEELLHDLAVRRPKAEIARMVHNSLAQWVVDAAKRLGVNTVVLTGGCFQNRLLLERCARLLRAAGHRVLTHRQVPPNDGGVALGQVIAANLGRESSLHVPRHTG